MALLFFLELLVLFFLSQKTTQHISFVLYRFTHSKKFAIYAMAILFLPGTIIHEFSHAIAAILTHVPVGRMELLPEYREGGLKLGSVQVGKTDIVRNFFIGVAPFLFGTILLLLMMYLVMTAVVPLKWWTIAPILYLVFAISNTMFSSKRDMEGAIEFFILIGVVLTVLYLLGFHPQEINWTFLSFSDAIFKVGVIYLLVPLGIDIGIVGLSFVFTKRL